MRIFNTKSCLTKGITEHDSTEIDGHIVKIPTKADGYYTYLLGEGKEWHRDLESAIIRAKEVKEKRIDSLRRSIKRINAIDFDEKSKK